MSKIYLVILFVITNSAFANSTLRDIALDDFARIEQYYEECEQVKEFGVRGDYDVQCFTNYHHFNASSDRFYHRKKRASREVKIASFNLFHPGSDSSIFKDYELVANIINSYDLVAAQEFLSLVGRDLKHNERIVKFLDYGASKLRSLKRKKETPSVRQQIKDLEKLVDQAKDMYRLPGYLRILNELRKQDLSWSLILSPSGDSAKTSSVHEFVGFYYRANMVIPKINEHCEKFKKNRHGSPIACFPSMRSQWLGRDVRQVFSRRPFMGSFISGSFDFTLFTTHVTFNGPTDKKRGKAILKAAFGLESISSIGDGVNASNYARFAEVKVTLEIMNKVRKESRERDIILLGDLNLESQNPYWKEILPIYYNMGLFVDDPTTLSQKRFLKGGKPSYGLSKNYDHILLDTYETNNCLTFDGYFNPQVDSFIDGKHARMIEERYLLRKRRSLQPILGSEAKKKKLMDNYYSYLTNAKTIKRNKLANEFNTKEFDKNWSYFKRRMLSEQFSDDTFYKVYKEAISDHLPISFSCNI